MRWIRVLLCWGVALASLSFRYIGQRGEQVVSLTCDGAVSTLALPSFGDCNDVSEIRVDRSDSVPKMFLKTSKTAVMFYNCGDLSKGRVDSERTESFAELPLITTVRMIETGANVDQLEPRELLYLPWNQLKQSPSDTVDIIDVTVNQRGHNESLHADPYCNPLVSAEIPQKRPVPNAEPTIQPPKRQNVPKSAADDGQAETPGDNLTVQPDEERSKQSQLPKPIKNAVSSFNKGDCVVSLVDGHLEQFIVHKVFLTGFKVVCFNPANGQFRQFCASDLRHCDGSDKERTCEASVIKPIPNGAVVQIKGNPETYVVLSRQSQGLYRLKLAKGGQELTVVDRCQIIYPVVMEAPLVSQLSQQPDETSMVTTHSDLASEELPEAKMPQSLQTASDIQGRFTLTRTSSLIRPLLGKTWVMQHPAAGTQKGPYYVHLILDHMATLIDPENDQSTTCCESELIPCNLDQERLGEDTLAKSRIRPLQNGDHIEIHGQKGSYKVIARSQDGNYKVASLLDGKEHCISDRGLIIFPILPSHSIRAIQRMDRKTSIPSVPLFKAFPPTAQRNFRPGDWVVRKQGPSNLFQVHSYDLATQLYTVIERMDDTVHHFEDGHLRLCNASELQKSHFRLANPAVRGLVANEWVFLVGVGRLGMVHGRAPNGDYIFKLDEQLIAVKDRNSITVTPLPLFDPL